MTRRVVVTGVGVITPVGNCVNDFWKSLINGVSGISKITKFNTDGFSVKIAGEVKNFDPNKYFQPKELKKIDSYTQYALVATKEAMEDAKIKIGDVDPTRVGVIIGSGIGGIETWEREFKNLQESPKKVSPFFIPMMIINIASAEVAIRVNAKGPNFSVVSACATGAHSICDAYRIIKEGKADVMITGGSESSITPLAVAGFSNMRALSTKNDTPEKASRPFDLNRDGFVIGEGCGILVIEELSFALKRGITPYCEIVGCGMTCDAYHIAAPEPSGREAARVMKLALEEGNIKPEEVDYINAHGTSTPLNDKSETEAIKQVFGDYAKKLHISSTKSMIGHLLGAAGAVELIVCCLSIKNSMIHPTINLETPDPECDLNYTPNKAIELPVKVAMSNSFGFGGHNVSIVVKKFEC